MKNRIKILLAVLTLLLATVFITSCGDEAPYASYGNAVTVEYDANGGTFTTNTSVECDSYVLSTVPVNRYGEYEIPLIDPNDSVRGTANTFLASKPGYFLVGWYAEYAVTDGEGNELDADGNIASESGKDVAYTYEKWDFEHDTFTFEKKTYSAEEPILRLVAMWLPEFSFEFYDLDTGAHLKSYSFDPNYVDGVDLPVWNEETGKLDMKDFPTVDGKTYQAVYYDSHGVERVDTDEVLHTGTVNEESVSASNSAMKLYVKMNEGAWYNIYTAEQLCEAADPAGNYNILADLDFAEEDWPEEFISGKFTGTVRGNGYTLKNISFEQSSASMSCAGLFGTVSSDALIEDVTFENVSLEIATGSRMPGASFALFAGILEDGATLDGVLISGKITVTPTPYITESTVIGLFCGTGDPGDVDITGIRCSVDAQSENETGLVLTVDGNTVTVTLTAADD